MLTETMTVPTFLPDAIKCLPLHGLAAAPFRFSQDVPLALHGTGPFHVLTSLSSRTEQDQEPS